MNTWKEQADKYDQALSAALEQLRVSEMARYEKQAQLLMSKGVITYEFNSVQFSFELTKSEIRAKAKLINGNNSSSESMTPRPSSDQETFDELIEIFNGTEASELVENIL